MKIIAKHKKKNYPDKISPSDEVVSSAHLHGR